MSKNTPITTILATSLLMYGCFATSVDSEKWIPAEYEAGARLKNVAVLPFVQGRTHDLETTTEVRATLTGIKVEGKKYFNVVERSRLDEIFAEQSNYTSGQFDRSSAIAIGKKLNANAVLYGEIQKPSEDKSDTFKTKDGRTCRTHYYTFQFIPRFVNVQTGVVEFEKKISKNADTTKCGSGGPNTVGMLNEARAKAMKEFRSLIAPYKVSESVKLLTNYCEPGGGGMLRKGMNSVVKTECDATFPSDLVLAKVEGGAKFAGADRMDRACKLWDEAAELHSEGYILPYLMGVCAEMLESNFTKAQKQYKAADQLTMGPVSTINEALERIERKLGQNKNAKKAVRKPSPVIMNAQKALVELGYDPGPVDGFSGKRTVTAITEFQLDNGLNANGKLDDQTKQTLGI